MNRTDRLYAIVEELRARAPRPLSTRVLAERFEVSTRTIERDIGALLEAGVPIWSETGRRGGYSLDPRTTLPPLNFTPEEATAIAIGLDGARDGPFSEAARTAAQKFAAVMSGDRMREARDLQSRIRVASADHAIPAELVRAVQAGVARRSVLWLRYQDADGDRTERFVEAHGLFGGPHGWYLIGWCRLREDGRIFRLDRVEEVRDTGESAPERDVDEVLGYVPFPVGAPEVIE